MNAVRPRGGHTDTTTLLRRGVLGLAAVTLVGTVLELAFLHHWDTATQTIVWLAVGLLALVLIILACGPSAAALRWAQAVTIAVFVLAGVGVWFHVQENLDAGPLDRRYAVRWDTMSGIDQSWAAITGEVGPAPTLAPGVLAEISFALLLATVRHPVLARAAEDRHQRSAG